MTKILLVSHEIPFPPDKNGNTENIYNIFRYLKQQKAVYIDLLVISNKEVNDEIEINNDNVHASIQTFINNIYIKRIRLNRHLFFLVKFFYKTNFGIKDTYDYAFFCNLESGQFITNIKIAQVNYLYAADSASLFYSRRKGLSNKLKYYFHKYRQQFLFPYFKMVIFVSFVDKDEVYRYCNNKASLTVIPIGFDPGRIDQMGKQIEKDFDILFTGIFSFAPNQQSALFILNILTPEIVKIYPDIKICLAGRNPSAEMYALAKKYKHNVIITGEVASLAEYFLRSKIFISPIFSGSGMKNKILQAMAAGLPIIASPESIAGVERTKGIILIETNEKWVNQIALLLNDNISRENLGNLNLIGFKNNYDWEIIIKKNYLNLFNMLINE